MPLPYFVIPVLSFLLMGALFFLLAPKDNVRYLQEIFDLRLLYRYFANSSSKSAFVGKVVAVLLALVATCGFVGGLFQHQAEWVGVSYACLFVVLFWKPAVRAVQNFTLLHLFILIAVNAIFLAAVRSALPGAELIPTTLASLFVGTGAVLLCSVVVQNFDRVKRVSVAERLERKRDELHALDGSESKKESPE